MCIYTVALSTYIICVCLFTLCAGCEGRAGMAALVLKRDHQLNGKRLYNHLVQTLPAYAWPRFLRIQVGHISTDTCVSTVTFCISTPSVSRIPWMSPKPSSNRKPSWCRRLLSHTSVRILCIASMPLRRIISP